MAPRYSKVLRQWPTMWPLKEDLVVTIRILAKGPQLTSEVTPEYHQSDQRIPSKWPQSTVRSLSTTQWEYFQRSKLSFFNAIYMQPRYSLETYHRLFNSIMITMRCLTVFFSTEPWSNHSRRFLFKTSKMIIVRKEGRLYINIIEFSGKYSV